VKLVLTLWRLYIAFGWCIRHGVIVPAIIAIETCKTPAKSHCRAAYLPVRGHPYRGGWWCGLGVFAKVEGKADGPDSFEFWIPVFDLFGNTTGLLFRNDVLPNLTIFASEAV